VIDLLYSDMHLQENRLAVFDQVHDEIIEIGIREGVIESGGAFINGGDTFHVRGLIRSSCFDLLYRKRREWRNRGLKRHIDIVGNHDQEDKDGEIHPMRVFEEFGQGWYVVDTPKFIEGDHCDYYAFPYMANLDKELKKIPTSKRKGAIALVHTGIHGAFKNDGELDDFSIHAKVFKGFLRTFSGHYHNRQLYDGYVQYIGSPTQHTFSEMGQDKGVLIYNHRTDEIKFVPIKGPKHHEVTVKWTGDKRVVEKPKGIGKYDYVRVRVHGSSEQVSTVNRKDFLKMFDCETIKIERKTLDTVSSRIKVDGATNEDLIDAYIDYVDPELDKGRLVNIGRKFMGVGDATV